MSTTLGIDEAGRGSILGEIVLAGVVFEEEKINQYKQLNLFIDSKSFGSGKTAINKRAKIAKEIKENFKYKIVFKTYKEIDTYVFKNKLNLLEQEMAKDILNYLKYDKAILDGKNIFSKLIDNKKNIQAINKADVNHYVVAAASILAKDFRDQKIVQYFNQLPNPLSNYKYQGMGYPNESTLKFIKDHFDKTNELPNNLRISYKWKKLNEWKIKNSII